MKKIGIIGGASAESTIDYYKYITTEYIKKYGDYAYPQILINSISFQKYVDFMKKNDFYSLSELLLNEGLRLQNAGADFIIIATNTFHLFIEELRGQLSIPILSIIDSVKKEIQKDNLKKVALLGTKLTMDFNLYGEKCKENNIDVLVPDEADKKSIDKIIFNELTKGLVKSESKKVFINIIDKMKSMGAQGVILGCTEIPMLIKNNDTDLNVYDTTFIHAMDALNYSLSDPSSN
ncbi:MAG: aspartate racemase [Kosmotogales bacterium]|nr:aspartate racemase [Kosmotogales bacterium]